MRLGKGAILLLAALFHSSALAQNEYETFVDQQLDALCYYTECDWVYEPLYRFIGSGAQGSTHSHSATLTAGEAYLFLAVCDRDCSDVDLFLYDPNGGLVASDSSVQKYEEFSTSNADFEFEPGYSGTYRLDVKIHNCPASTCYYGAAVGIAFW